MRVSRGAGDRQSVCRAWPMLLYIRRNESGDDDINAGAQPCAAASAANIVVEPMVRRSKLRLIPHCSDFHDIVAKPRHKNAIGSCPTTQVGGDQSNIWGEGRRARKARIKPYIKNVLC